MNLVPVYGPAKQITTDTLEIFKTQVLSTSTYHESSFWKRLLKSKISKFGINTRKPAVQLTIANGIFTESIAPKRKYATATVYFCSSVSDMNCEKLINVAQKKRIRISVGTTYGQKRVYEGKTKTDREIASRLLAEFRLDTTKNIRAFSDNIKIKFGFLKKQNLYDTLLLEWDTILDDQRDSEQLIIPLFVKDHSGPIRLENLEYTQNLDGRWMDLEIKYPLNLFVREIQEHLNKNTPSTQSFRDSFRAKLRPKQFQLDDKDDPEIFINCDKEVKKIAQILERGNFCNVWGLGGFGKTFVANKFAFSMFRRGYSIAKLTVDSEQTLSRDFSNYWKSLLEIDTDLRLRFYWDEISKCKVLDHFSDGTQPTIYKDFYAEDACVAYLKKMTSRGFADAQCSQIHKITNGFPLRLTAAAQASDTLFPLFNLSVADELSLAAYFYSAVFASVDTDWIRENYLIYSIEAVKISQPAQNINASLVKIIKEAITKFRKHRAFFKCLGFSLWNTVATSGFKIDLRIKSEIRDDMRRLKPPAMRKAAVYIAILYDLKTASYHTLRSELRLGRVYDVEFLFNKWERCIVNGEASFFFDFRHLRNLAPVDNLDYSISDLETICRGLLKNTSVKVLCVRGLRGKKDLS
ncbi:hypothetical protein HK098_000762 [Nowakowskiella sp. JEL0407]|nr:hypothetical protein HK098_000762 [Nowakowskiella sp. JEL0407]